MKKLIVFFGIVLMGAAIMSFQSNEDTSSSANTGAALKLTDAAFNETIKDGVTLVDFWATWCPPCRKLGPIVEEVALEIGDRAVVAKLDVDHNKQTARAYAVQSIPTIIIFKNGKVVERYVGVQPKAKLIAAIEKHL